MADNQSVMGSSRPLVEPALPQLRPSGVGRLAWALANVAGRPGPRYGVLLFAIAAGLIGSAAMLGHAGNAIALAAFDRSPACGAAASPSCRTMESGVLLDDRPLPLGIHAVTVVTDGRRAVYYGWAIPGASRGVPANSEALVFAWRGRAFRVFSEGLSLDPIEGPPGASFALIAVAAVSEVLCGVALVLHGMLWRLRARGLPVVFARTARPWYWPPAWYVVLGILGVLLLAGRSGHALIAVPLHVLCALLVLVLGVAAGLRSARALVPMARRGMDALSEEPALRLGGDVALAAVLVALCLSLAADLVVADLLSLPR